MKRIFWIFLAATFVFLSTAVIAENSQAEIRAVAEGLGLKEPRSIQVRSKTAVCMGEKDGLKTLCLLEKENGSWKAVIMNSNAFFQSLPYPKLSLESDNHVCWQYEIKDIQLKYECFREVKNNWGIVAEREIEKLNDKAQHDFWALFSQDNGGEFEIVMSYANEQEKQRYTKKRLFILAPWLKDNMYLDAFDARRFPIVTNLLYGMQIAEKSSFFDEAAAYLMPNYSCISSNIVTNDLHFVMQKPTGEKVYVVCCYDSNSCKLKLIESTPLPNEAHMHAENFDDMLSLPNKNGVLIRHFPNRSLCGVSMSFSTHFEQPFYLGPDCAFSADDPNTMYFGINPWSDISQIDWESVPASFSEAVARLEQGNFAIVNNPNNEDRLHLREKPDKTGRSFGKYYNGTPVRISEIKGDWAKCKIGSQSGWMMKKYLKMPEDGKPLSSDISALYEPKLASGEELILFSDTNKHFYDQRFEIGTMKIIGIIGNELYHVWFPMTGEYLFIHQSLHEEASHG